MKIKARLTRLLLGIPIFIILLLGIDYAFFLAVFLLFGDTNNFMLGIFPFFIAPIWVFKLTRQIIDVKFKPRHKNQI